jgi:uncharacterized membrane protein SpoIIM required for sporulation
VTILALLLVRVGIAHFEREYLLGREIDVINFRWMWRMFWRYFIGGAHSLLDWYRHVVSVSLRRLGVPTILMIAIALVGIWLGYDWIMDNFPGAIATAPPEEVAKLAERARRSPEIMRLRDSFSAPFLFMNNTRAMVSILVAGLLSFSVLGILIYLVNISLIGGLFGAFELLGISPWPLFLAGVLPHGVFEIPALMIGSAAVLYIGVGLVTPQTGKSLGEVVIELLADWAKIFIGIVVPLLAVAALIEAYITPAILLATINR